MAGLAAVLRAARPQARTDADRLAFAVHAYMLADGYQLTAAGAAADGDAPLDAAAPEVGPDGWDALDGVYAFRYTDATSARRPPILLKAASVGTGLTVTWLVGGLDTPPRGVELAVSDFVHGGAYTSLDTLEAVLRAGLHGRRDDDEVAATGTSAGGGASHPPDRAPAPPPPTGPHPHPGDADRFPPGLGPGLPGVVHPFPYPPGVGGVGGGSMVGPNDPLFGGHPGAGIRPPAPWGGPPPPGLPPGARWDPIAPPGVPGFAPTDFRPPPGPRPPGGPRPPHPDIMPPGPGGADPGWGGGMFG